MIQTLLNHDKGARTGRTIDSTREVAMGPDGVVRRRPRGPSIPHPSKLELSCPKLWLRLDAVPGKLGLVACTEPFQRKELPQPTKFA